MPKSYNKVEPPARVIFEIEDLFFEYTDRRLFATLETISQMLFCADIRAQKIFQKKEVTKDELLSVDSVAHSSNWGGKKITMSASTMRIIRKDLEFLGFFKQKVFIPKWAVDKVKSRITELAEFCYEGLAQLARRIMNVLIDRLGFDATMADHDWGFLASIVRLITGQSLFTLEDGCPESTPAQREARAEKEAELLVEELENAEGIDDLVRQIFLENKRKIKKWLAKMAEYSAPFRPGGKWCGWIEDLPF